MEARGWIRAAATLVLATGICRAEGETGPAPVLVRLFNIAGVAENTLAEARAVATDVYAAAGISIRWADGETAMLKVLQRLPVQRANPGCPSVSVVNVKLGYMTVAERPKILAYAFPYHRDGVRVVVGIERVHAHAAAAKSSAGRLLGLVLAHEIGHVLKGADGHSTSGLMRPQLDRNGVVDDLSPGTRTELDVFDLLTIRTNLRRAATPNAACGDMVAHRPGPAR